jgi:hypothetical protein
VLPVRAPAELEQFLVANLHASTTRADEPAAIARDTPEILEDRPAASSVAERFR